MKNIEILPKDDGFQDCGLICAANEARFTSANYSEPLTAFTVGWKDSEKVEELLNFVAPAVPVARRFEFKVADSTEPFLSETDDIRSIGSAFKRVEFTGTSVTSKTYNKGLTIRVDHDDVAGDDWRERYVQLLLQRLYRNELRRAVSALSGNAISQVSTYVWSTASGTPNPDADVRAELEAASNLTGVRPNRIILGEGAWDIRSDAYDCQNNAGANRAAGLSLGELARKLFVDEVRIMGARYQDVSSKTAILGNEIYAFFTKNEIMKDEPANIKRFVTPVDGGSTFRVYVDERSKFSDITVEHYSNIVITSATGIRKLAVSSTDPQS
ncbi:MAG: hypothetical protein LBJ94_02505 [Puniceicoccales bacterium]|jgi:hypothetical protein|nr:hypothetical protein [Puniceicoccales bacterium]